VADGLRSASRAPKGPEGRGDGRRTADPPHRIRPPPSQVSADLSRQRAREPKAPTAHRRPPRPCRSTPDRDPTIQHDRGQRPPRGGDGGRRPQSVPHPRRGPKADETENEQRTPHPIKPPRLQTTPTSHGSARDGRRRPARATCTTWGALHSVQPRRPGPPAGPAGPNGVAMRTPLSQHRNLIRRAAERGRSGALVQLAVSVDVLERGARRFECESPHRFRRAPSWTLWARIRVATRRPADLGWGGKGIRLSRPRPPSAQGAAANHPPHQAPSGVYQRSDRRLVGGDGADPVVAPGAHLHVGGDRDPLRSFPERARCRSGTARAASGTTQDRCHSG